MGLAWQDEPTTALDMRDGEVICRLLRDLGRDGMVVMASLSGRPTPATWDCFTHLLLMSPQVGHMLLLLVSVALAS